jgi:autotransporter-associated beta strand protein
MSICLIHGHRRLIASTMLLLMSFWQVTQPLHGATFLWTDAAGNTSVGVNWSGGVSPNTSSVAGDVFNFNNALTAPRTVTLDGLLTGGTLNIGDTTSTNAFTLAAGTGGYLIMDAISGSAAINKTGNALDTISTPLQFNDTLAITNSATTGTLTLSGALRSLTSDITFNGTGAVAAGSTIVSGAISTAGNLIKNDAGITTLSGVNTYTGTTTVNGGTLILSNAASLPIRSAVTVGALGTLSIQNAMTIGSLAGAGLVTNTTGTARILTIGRDDTSTSFTGQLTATTPANLAITKIGAGTLTLAPAAASTYTGNTVINGGTINLDFANTALTSLLAATTPLQITGGNFTMTGKAGLAANQLLGALTVGATGGAITLVAGDATGTTLRTGAVTATASGGALLITAPANTTFQMGTSYAAATLNNRIVFSNGTANTFNWAVNTGANTTTTAFGAYTALPIAGGGANTTAYNLTASQTQTTAAFVGRSVKLGSTLGSAQTWDLATFNATLGGAATASPGAILIDGTDAWNINGSTGVLGQATVAGGDLIFQQYNTTNAVTVNAGIANGAGTLNLVKAGPGTLVLAGTNTFTGTVVVAGGTLSFSNVTAAGAGSLGNGSTTAVTIRDGATLQYTGATGSISGAATTAGAHTYALQGGNANIEVTQTNTLLTLAGVVSGAGGFTKLGTGTLQLNGATNTFSGPVFINNGVLQGGGSNFIADTTPVTLGATGSLDINGTAASQTETIGSISGSGVIFNSNTNTKTLAVGGDNTSTTFSGTFAANGSVAGGLATGVAGNILTKQGSGVLTLTNAVTSAWTGGNNVNGGVLRLGASNTLSSTGTTTIGLAAGPAALELGAVFTQTLAALTFHGTGATTTSQGNVIIGTGATLTVVGNITYNGAQNALGAVISGPGNYSIGGADRTITVNDSTTVSSSAAELTISTPIASVGAFGITKAGAGNLLLSGNNTYTGVTTIGGAGGTTTFSGSNTSMTGATTLNSATLILDYSSNPTTRKMGSGLFSALGGTLVLNGNTSTPSLETITGNTTFAAGGRVAITLNRAGQDLALNLGTLTRAAGAGTVRFNLPTGTQSGTNGILTSTSADATTGLLGTGGAWATVTDATGTNFATKSGNNIVAVTPTAVPTITSWVTGQNVTDSTVYTGTLDAETAINSLRFNASAGASTVAITPGGLLRIASGGILQTDQVTGGVSTISGGRLESSSGSELVFTTDSATQRLDVSSTITGASLITKTGNGTLRLSGNSNATGAVSLQAGTLELTGGNALGDTAAVTLTALGGGTPTLSLLANQTETIGSLSGGQTTNTSAAVSLGASSTLTINQGADTSYTGRLVGDGTLVKSGAFALQLDNTSAAFTGALRVDQGQVTLSGNLGNLTGLNSVVVNGAGTLRLNYADNNSGDRIRDLATVTVNNTIFAAGGGLRINNTSNTGRTETLGALTLGAGHNSIWVDGTNTGNHTTTMTFASLTANNRATSLVVGRSLGTMLAAANESRIIFTTAPSAIGGGGLAGTTNISIVPHLIGESTAGAPTSANVGNSFVSLGDGTNGVRPLNLTTEYLVDQAAPATGTNNLRYTASNTITTPAAINALALDSGSAIALTGSASSMDIGSGAILAAGAGAHSIGTITGLTTTAATYYTYVTNAAGSLTLTTPLTTAVPLAKSGAGTLILNTASHAYTDLFFNHGVVQADALNKLGSGAFNFHGGTLKFGAAFDPSTKTMTFGTGGAVFDTTGFDITFANAVGNSGTGGLTKIGTNNLMLQGANTFTGATSVTGGRLILDGGTNQISSTAGLTLSGTSSFQLGGTTAANQTVTSLVGATGNSIVGGNASVSSLTVNQSTDTTYAGLIGGAGTNENNVALVKTGGGILTLGAVASTFTGGIAVRSGGVVSGNNAGTFGTGTITLGDTVGGANADITFFNTLNFANPVVVASGSSGAATIFLGTTTGGPNLSGGITLNKDLILSKLGTSGNGQVTGGITGTGNLIISNNATTGTITLATGAINPTGSITNSGLATGTTTISADIGSSVTSIIQKSATSAMTLSGANIAFTGGISVNAGTLNITGGATTAPTPNALTVDGGATLNLANAAGQRFNLGSGTINLGTGSGTTTLNLELGAISGTLYDSFLTTGAATTAGTVQFNITNVGMTTGTYNLLQAGSGLNSATYTFGALPGGFAYSSASSATSVDLIVSALTNLFWQDSQGDGRWNTLTAPLSGLSNWSTDLAGAVNAGGIPGVGSVVTFSSQALTVDSPTTATTLETPFSIDSLVFNNQTNSGAITAVTIAPGAAGTLTLAPASSANGINVQTGAPASIGISAPVILGAAQTWTVADALTTLTASGIVSGGVANSNQVSPGSNTSLTIKGSGVVDLTNAANTFSGDILVDGGTFRVDDLDDWGGPTVASTTSKTITLDNGGRLNVNATLNPGATTTTSYKLLQIGTGGGTISVADTFTLSLDDAGQLFGNGALTKSGLGTIVLRNQGASYGGFGGTLDVTEGTLQMLGTAIISAPLGSITAGTTIRSGAAFNLAGTVVAEAEPLTIYGLGLTATPVGVITNSSGTASSFAGPVTLGADSTIGSNAAGGITLSGAIDGAFNLTINNRAAGGMTLSNTVGGVNNTGTISNVGIGAGTTLISGNIGSNVTDVIQNSATSGLTLSGTNTFTGGVDLMAGTLTPRQHHGTRCHGRCPHHHGRHHFE